MTEAAVAAVFGSAVHAEPPMAGEFGTYIDDPEILAGFVEESLALLDEAEHLALRIESGARDADGIDALFRCMHTIKGTSSFLGVDEITQRAHDCESLLMPLRDRGAWSDADSDRLIAAIDELRCLIRVRQVARTDESTAEAGAAVDAWTRVGTQRLDRMLDAIGELVVLQSMLAREAEISGDRNGRVAELIGSAGKMARELQDLSIDVRMVPLAPSFRKLSRVVRDISQSMGKQVELVTRGGETELDRNIVDLIIDPLTHMVRNAIDHGFESAPERARQGKSAQCTLRLSAEPAGDQIVLELADDGRGLDVDRIRARAIQLGWISADAVASDADLFQFIFAPGFSTAEKVTNVSGRGVGMDVVRRNIDSLRGRIEIASQKGRGTTFRIIVPLTLAITNAMLVRIGTERYLIPVLNIRQSLRADPLAIRTVAGAGEVVTLREEVLPVVRLQSLLQVPMAGPLTDRPILVVIGAADRQCALAVDELIAQHQVIAKPLGGALGRTPAIAGAAILGDGSVGLILDVAGVIKLSFNSLQAGEMSS